MRFLAPMLRIDAAAMNTNPLLRIERFAILLTVLFGLCLAPAAARAFVFKPQSEQIKAIAAQFLTIRFNCEFGQHVDIKVRADHLGYVDVTFLGKTSHMLPVVSDSGALRLESELDHKFWLQLSVKGMLFDTQEGSRVADDCQPS